MMMMNMCLRKPDDSSGRDLHLNLAPTTDLHERNEAAAEQHCFRQAHLHLADPCYLSVCTIPFDKMCIYFNCSLCFFQSEISRAGTPESCVDFLDPGTTRQDCAF